HVSRVVHEEGTELSACRGDGPRLRGTRARLRARDVPGRVVVDDVVAKDIVAAQRVALVNPILAVIHDDVVGHGRVIVGRDGRIGGDLNAVYPAIRHYVVGDDLVGGAVVALNARRGRAGDDVVLDDRIRAGDVDAVSLVDLPPGADVVHHIPDDLNACDPVIAAGAHDRPREGGAGHVMDAVADDPAILAVGRDTLVTASGDVEVDDLDVIAVIRDGGAVRPIDLRAPFGIGNVGEERGGRPALGHAIGGVAPGVVAGGHVGVVARVHELRDALQRVAGGGGGAGIPVRAPRRDVIVGAIAQRVERCRIVHARHRDCGRPALPFARRGDGHRADPGPGDQPGAAHRGHPGGVRRPGDVAPAQRISDGVRLCRRQLPRRSDDFAANRWTYANPVYRHAPHGHGRFSAIPFTG